MWEEDTLPSQWGEAEISYLYKGDNKSKADVTSYRPISLIPIIAKMLTRCWLPRLVQLSSPAIGKEQGCGRKQQGSLEHLWALVKLLEDCSEGRDGHQDKGVYALFANVSKAYDQVWRSGLYTLLYSYGIRGRMWSMIQHWLDNSSATTKWNGVTGPKVPLAEGLRQGCVLSPIPYCVFISALTSPPPQGAGIPAMPEGMGYLSHLVFSQG